MPKKKSSPESASVNLKDSAPQAPDPTMSVELNVSGKRRAYKDLDFVDFGANSALGAHVFRLRVSRTTGEALLVEDYGSLIDGIHDDDPEQPRAQLPMAVWEAVAGYVQKDFNARLKEKGYKVGKWKTEGEVLIDRLLGRELSLLWWALEGVEANDHTRIGAAVRAWQSLRPEERWWLAGTIVSQAGGVKDGSLGWRRAIRLAMIEGSRPPMLEHVSDEMLEASSMVAPAPVGPVELVPEGARPDVKELRVLVQDLGTHLKERSAMDAKLSELLGQMGRALDGLMPQSSPSTTKGVGEEQGTDGAKAVDSDPPSSQAAETEGAKASGSKKSERKRVRKSPAKKTPKGRKSAAAGKDEDPGVGSPKSTESTSNKTGPGDGAGSLVSAQKKGEESDQSEALEKTDAKSSDSKKPTSGRPRAASSKSAAKGKTGTPPPSPGEMGGECVATEAQAKLAEPSPPAASAALGRPPRFPSRKPL